MHIRGIDHVVLNVSDMDRSVAWYRDRLGLAPERYEEWKRQEVPFVSLRIDDHTLIDLLVAERTGVNADHVSLWVGPDVDIDELASSGDFDVVAGPMEIWGAQGHGPAIYVRDPDGNTIELKSYPWS